MNRARIYLLILTMFFSYSVHSISVSNEFGIQYSKRNMTSFENGAVFALDTLTQSIALIRRHSQEKDSTGIRYTKKYNYKNFPFFNFRISKKTVYHKLSEFNSEQAKELFVLAKNDQFNSDSLTREVSLLYTKQGVYSEIDKDLFKRRVRDLEQRSEELKKNAAQKAKHAKVLEQTSDKAPTLILAATQEEVTPAYEGSQNTTKDSEPARKKNQEVEVKTGGVYESYELLTENSDVTCASGAIAEVNVSSFLEAKVRFGGKIYYKGDPEKVTTQKVIGGTIKNKG